MSYKGKAIPGQAYSHAADHSLPSRSAVMEE